MKGKKGWLLLLLLTLLLTGCRKQEEDGLRLYYIGNSGYELKSEIYQPENTESAQMQVEELVDQMKNKDIGGNIHAIPSSMELERYYITNKILYLYWKGNYEGMTAERKVLFQAALAKTLTQLPDINYILLMVNGATLTDQDGSRVGLLNANSYIENIQGDSSDYKSIVMSLYYADTSGSTLIKKGLDVSYTSADILERILIQQLLQAPWSSDVIPTFNSSASLLGISVRDGICSVNFDEAFLNCPENVNPTVMIYALVNSLTELPSVSKVQIMINSSSDYVIGGVNLSIPLERNESYIGGGIH